MLRRGEEHLATEARFGSMTKFTEPGEGGIRIAGTSCHPVVIFGCEIRGLKLQGHRARSPGVAWRRDFAPRVGLRLIGLLDIFVWGNRRLVGRS